jgi:hypothetical protein
MRLTPNIRKKIPYLFGVSPLEDNTEYLTGFSKNIWRPNRFGLQKTSKRSLKT